MNTADYFDIPPLPRSGGDPNLRRPNSGNSNHSPSNNNRTAYPPSMYSGNEGYREPRVNGPNQPQHQSPSQPSPNNPQRRHRNASPMDPRGTNLRDMFASFDKNRSGYLSETELANNLYNEDGTRFARDTTRLMFRMFDLDRNGKINFDEFVELWRYLCEWKGIFQRMDTDESRKVTFPEFRRAVESFGYNLGPNVIKSLFSIYANSFDARNQPAMPFDMFVQAFVRLRNVTESFKRFDTDRDGYITLGFEQYLLEVSYLQ